MTQPSSAVYHVDLTAVALTVLEKGIDHKVLVGVVVVSGAANIFLLNRFVAEKQVSTQLADALQRQVTLNHAKRLEGEVC